MQKKAIIKEEILTMFKKAGMYGLKKKDIGAKNSNNYDKKLKELMAEKKVVTYGTFKKSNVYVLAEFFNPMEWASELILKITEDRKNKVISISELKDEIIAPSVVKLKAGMAVDWLIKEGGLLLLKHSGKNLYINTNFIKQIAESSGTEKGKTSNKYYITLEKALKAYKEMTTHTGFQNVYISELQRKLNIPMDELKNFLVEQSRNGNVILAIGDWSIADDKARAGAINMLGSRHLLVCFKD